MISVGCVVMGSLNALSYKLGTSVGLKQIVTKNYAKRFFKKCNGRRLSIE